MKRRVSFPPSVCLLLLGGPAMAQPAPVSPAAISGGDTAWMLLCSVLVLLMTLPGVILFYSGMLRSKNALSIVAQGVASMAVVTMVWTLVAYSLAFTPGNGFFGGLDRALAEGIVGGATAPHPSAPTVPEAAFFVFQLAFAIITFVIILGATAERIRLGATVLFAGAWTVLVYAPVAHWVWHPTGWLDAMGHMDYAGGTVVHIASGASALTAAWVLGPRRGFGREPMVPHNLLVTVLGAGLMWAGWFGFNAGSAFAASDRAAGALLVTQVGACSGAILWGICEHIHRGQWSVLGTMTGAIAGLIAITPASGYVTPAGALAIGAAGGVLCFLCVVNFKARTGIDDSLDVFALHGVGGLVGTVLTPVFASAAIAKVTANVGTQLIGALAVAAYAMVATWLILRVLGAVVKLRVDAAQEQVGLDISEHGEMIAPNA
ncbi:MAG: ammonium transporter [Burkholderiaceae bacterium]|jgi:Amt family ammonium transporter|nr:ammonium transporter [Burkholderiaceae bacterium]MCZ8176640.1 ammonium transporter [Burkholderiaceae bacterium]